MGERQEPKEGQLIEGRTFNHDALNRRRQTLMDEFGRLVKERTRLISEVIGGMNMEVEGLTQSDYNQLNLLFGNSDDQKYREALKITWEEYSQRPAEGDAEEVGK